ncbi:MAG: SpoIIE family protein phosphatase [Candidatus Omnitrophota bacterium]
MIGAAYFLFIGLLVYLKNKKSPLNISFGLMCLVSFVWQFSFTMMLLSKDSFYPMFWNKLLGSGVVFIDLGWYLYVINLCRAKGKLYTRVLPCFFLLKSLVFGYLVITSDLILAALRNHAFGYYITAGRLHPLFLLLFIATIASGLVILLKAYFKIGGKVERLKLKYVAIGVAIYSLACVDYIPMYTKVSLYPFGDIFIIVFISILFYGIVRYRAMEIDTVIHRTALWAISVLLLIVPLCFIIALAVGHLVTLSLFLRVVALALTLLVFLDYYHRLKPRIDHLFRRRKYDYYHLLGEIIQKIGSELDINEVINRLLELKEILYIRNEVILVQDQEQMDYIEVGRKGYERFPEQQKQKPVSLARASALGRWLAEKRRALEKEQVEADPQYGPIKEEALSFLNENAMEVLIPVVMENKVNALVGIGKKENLSAYTVKDIELLESMGRQIGVTIDNALHHQDIVEKERLAEEMKLGREIQMGLLPRKPPAVAGLNVQGLMQPAREIGGDYYDFITLPDKDNISIVIGDVSGKGVAAGLFMAMAKTAIHTLSQEETSPMRILVRTNHILNQHIGGQKFMTMLYLMWRPHNATLTYSSAGHERILLYRDEIRQVEVFKSGGFMLGMIADIEVFLEENEIKLKPRDKILLYTDGVTEAQNSREEQFGIDRLKESFRKHSEKSALELMNAVKEEVYSFIGNHPQYDDISLVVLEAQ